MNYAIGILNFSQLPGGVFKDTIRFSLNLKLNRVNFRGFTKHNLLVGLNLILLQIRLIFYIIVNLKPKVL